MISVVRLKVCGLTSLVDAEAADGIGADYLGFILYPKSPRYVSLAQFVAMKARLPDRPKVAVLVTPTPADVAAARAAGFDFFQIHFPMTLAREAIALGTLVTHERLWLAPKLTPGEEIPRSLLTRDSTWLLDTYRPDGYGGTGRTGDWEKFRRYRETHPQHTWILAGGLSPDNVRTALAETGAKFIDVNSGVEQSPGVKDPAKLAALRTAMQAPLS
jgi:phosphoribosylanthranilate isomerase